MASKYKNDNYYVDLEDLYKRRFASLVRYALPLLNDKDYAIDAVHDALIKTQVYLNTHPKGKVSERLVKTLIFRACKKKNKDKCGITIEPLTDFTKHAGYPDV